MKFGMLPQNIVRNLVHRLGISLPFTERYLFNKKACYKHTNIDNYSFQNTYEDSLRYSITRCYPVYYGFKQAKYFLYHCEDGRFNFALASFHKAVGVTIKLIITAWYENEYSKRVVFDAIHPGENASLYRLNDIVNRRNPVRAVLICPDKYVFEIISNQCFTAMQA